LAKTDTHTRLRDLRSLFSFVDRKAEQKTQKLRPFSRLALDEGEWSASDPGRFTQDETPTVLNEQKAELPSEPIWILWRRNKPLAFVWKGKSDRPAHRSVTIATTLCGFY